MALALRLLALGALVSEAGAVKAGSRMGSHAAVTNHANPIRRVVDLLQNMQKQVTEEGKTEEELYNKFMCYCTTGKGSLEQSIELAGDKVEKVQASLAEAESRKKQLDADIKKEEADRKAGEEAVAKAKALRAKEKAEWDKFSSDSVANISAIRAAIKAITKGMEGSFLQSQSAVALKRLVMDAEMPEENRQALTSFLAQGQASSSDYAPQSGQIVGILEQMADTMTKEVADAQFAEEKSIADFESLVAARTEEIDALTASIEQKLESSGNLAVEIADMREDIDDTEKSLEEDKIFLAELEKGCGTKEKEWEARSKMRTDELLAIADTIKILNGDDALELFKKTLPSPTLIQMKVTAKEMQRSAARALQRAKSVDKRVALIAMQLQGGAKSFDKVISMIDKMVELLGKEQKADDEKKAYCEKELDTAEDEKKVLDVKLSDLDKTIDDMKETIATLKDDIDNLLKGIKDLDKAVKEATETRQAENTEYKKVMQEDTAAKEILKMAKNRLAKFYAPKLYKPPSQAERDAVGRISEEMSMSQQRADPGPPPATWGAYQKQDEKNGGVIAMMDVLINDLDKDMTAGKTEEEDAQKEYEEYIADAAAKRAADSKAITDKEGEKAELGASLVEAEQERKGTVKDLYLKEMLIRDLHMECDWLLSNFEVRRQARAGEADALTKAKAVLSGADYSLMQMSSKHTLLRGR